MPKIDITLGPTDVVELGKPKHTPGPWTITSQKGELTEAYWVGPGDYCSIAEVRHGADDEEYGGPEAELANAHLIAAAPDLLFALRGIMGMIESGVLVRDTNGDGKPGWSRRQLPLVMALKRANEAIAKAEPK